MSRYNSNRAVKVHRLFPMSLSPYDVQSLYKYLAVVELQHRQL
jgi:hypothetical protein